MGADFRSALASHLVEKGLAEPKAGYGHATGEQVADAVISFLENQPRQVSADAEVERLRGLLRRACDRLDSYVRGAKDPGAVAIRQEAGL